MLVNDYIIIGLINLLLLSLFIVIVIQNNIKFYEYMYMILWSWKPMCGIVVEMLTCSFLNSN